MRDDQSAAVQVIGAVVATRPADLQVRGSPPDARVQVRQHRRQSLGHQRRGVSLLMPGQPALPQQRPVRLEQQDVEGDAQLGLQAVTQLRLPSPRSAVHGGSRMSRPYAASSALISASELVRIASNPSSGVFAQSVSAWKSRDLDDTGRKRRAAGDRGEQRRDQPQPVPQPGPAGLGPGHEWRPPVGPPYLSEREVQLGHRSP